MRLRNTILRNLEKALTEEDPTRKQALMNIVVVGGGASGVEIAGAVAEMKKNIIARDYPDLDSSQMHIYLVNASDRLLSAMDPMSSKRAEADLKSCMYIFVNHSLLRSIRMVFLRPVLVWRYLHRQLFG